MTIEQAHAEAFAQLTPQQRQLLLQQLSAYLTTEELAAGLGVQNDPASLARVATLIEIRRPGTLETIYRSMSNVGVAPATTSGRNISNDGFLNMAVWLSLSGLVAQEFFADPMYAGFDPVGAAGYDFGDGSNGDFGGGDFGGGDFGGGLGGIL